MKYILSILLIVTTNIAVAQISISVAKIKQTSKGKPQYGPIIDTVKITNKEKAQKIYKLIQDIAKNGTEDINKCFIPRDVILVYKNETLVAKALICFECDGIRVQENIMFKENKTIKSISKREKQMEELESLLAYKN